MSDRFAGLYLHVPFCARVCPYCDFAVRTGNAERRRAFVEFLLAEIDLRAGYPLTFETVYFGGGTPSCLPAAELERVIAGVSERLDTVEDPWIFLEANPEDVTEENVEAWLRMGVRTLSIGIQSFDAGELAFLGRAHTADQVGESIRIATDAGFHTVSMDLIYGLPDQTADAWRRRLDAAIECEPDHFACYQLTIHERTRFALLERRGELRQLPEGGQAELFRVTHEHLAAAGYAGYEVSAFAREEEHRSLHNLKYWNHTPYLGLGPSAHSFDRGKRWWNLRKTDPWQDAIDAGTLPVDSEETLTRRDLLLETLMTGLRTYRGVEAGELLETNADLVRRLRESGLIKLHGTRILPTLDGLAVADSLATMFRLASS